MIYEKTEDKNVIRQVETVESEIHLDKLEEQINELKENVSKLTFGKIEYQPCANANTKKAIDFYNKMNSLKSPVEKIGLEKQLKEKQDLIIRLKGL